MPGTEAAPLTENAPNIPRPILIQSAKGSIAKRASLRTE
jgi:hypothetical protein